MQVPAGEAGGEVSAPAAPRSYAAAESILWPGPPARASRAAGCGAGLVAPGGGPLGEEPKPQRLVPEGASPSPEAAPGSGLEKGSRKGAARFAAGFRAGFALCSGSFGRRRAPAGAESHSGRGLRLRHRRVQGSAYRGSAARRVEPAFVRQARAWQSLASACALC